MYKDYCSYNMHQGITIKYYECYQEFISIMCVNSYCDRFRLVRCTFPRDLLSSNLLCSVL